MVSARRRLAASGICSAIMAAISESVMRRRARTRAICTLRGAETTTTWSTCRSPPVSNSSGMSSTAKSARAARARARKRRCALPHHGVQDLLQLAQCGRVGQDFCAQRGAVQRAVGDGAGKRLGDRGQGAAVRAPCRAWTVASASNTGTPARRKAAAAVDLPMPIPPVRPMIFMWPVYRRPSGR